MSKFNNDVSVAINIRDEYKKYNQTTIEKYVGYDPKTKCRYFKKIAVDPKATDFKKKFIISKRVKKAPENTKDIRPKKEKQKVASVKDKKKNTEPKKPRELNIINNKKEQIKKLHEEGHSFTKIAEVMKISEAQVSRHMKAMNITKITDRFKKIIEILENIKQFCTENKTNLFFTTYKKEIVSLDEVDRKQIAYILSRLEKLNKIKKENIGNPKVVGLCYRVFSEKEFSERHLTLMKDSDEDFLCEIKEFCQKLKTNIFFTAYNKEYDLFPKYDIKVLNNKLEKLSKSGKITKLNLGISKKYGNAFQVFNDIKFNYSFIRKPYE